MRNVWTNNTYADWLKTNGVPVDVTALVRLKWDGHEHRPEKVIEISTEGMKRDKITPPKDNHYYEFLRYHKFEHSEGYSIGGSTKFKGCEYKK